MSAEGSVVRLTALSGRTTCALAAAVRSPHSHQADSMRPTASQLRAPGWSSVDRRAVRISRPHAHTVCVRRTQLRPGGHNLHSFGLRVVQLCPHRRCPQQAAVSAGRCVRTAAAALMRTQLRLRRCTMHCAAAAAAQLCRPQSGAISKGTTTYAIVHCLNITSVIQLPKEIPGRS